jgi:hypothetical protein
MFHLIECLSHTFTLISFDDQVSWPVFLFLLTPEVQQRLLSFFLPFQQPDIDNYQQDDQPQPDN